MTCARTLEAPQSVSPVASPPGKGLNTAYGIIVVIRVIYVGYHLMTDLAVVRSFTAFPFILLITALTHRARLRVRKWLSRHGQCRGDRDLYSLSAGEFRRCLVRQLQLFRCSAFE